MGKWKRSGADALREYENTTNYAYNQGGNTLTQGKKPTRWGTDALYEYEQGGGLERAYENYKAAVLERQRAAISKANYKTKQNYQQQEQERKAELTKVQSIHGASDAVKGTAYENYVNAVKQRELMQKQSAGATLTPNEQLFLQTQQYKNLRTVAQEDAKQTNVAYQTAQKVAQAQVAAVEAREDIVPREKFERDSRLLKQYGTYKNYMAQFYTEAAPDAMKQTSDELQAEIDELTGKINDTAYDPDIYEKYKNGEIQSRDEMWAQVAELEQEKTLLDQKRALKRGDVALGALDEETLGLLDEYVHGASGYVREHANGYNQPGQSKKSARQDLIAKGYTEDEIKKLAEFYERREDYESATAEYAEMQELAANASGVGKAALSAATALGTPFKALGNIESVRGVLPSWLGGYQNEDIPTNIYSGLYRPVRVSSAIRSGTMADMGATGQFLYQAGMSALDSAVNMGVSVGLVGAAGLSGSAAQSATASTMNWVMGSQVAADSVYQGIQSGKSNSDALIDGIVEGAIEGITEKYSVGDIIENLLSGKAVWKKVVRAFASEGAEEVASNWLNRLYDVTLKHDRSEILQAYNAYLKQGMDEKTALAKTLGDFAKEDGLSFLAGGLSGLAMSGTYQLFGDLSTEANVQSAAAWAIENGRVQDVIDIGLAQGEGKAYEQAAKMQEKVDAGQTPTQGEAASILREYAKTQREAAEDAQGEKPEQEDKTYQTYKNAVQEAERATAAFEAAKSGTQTSGDGESMFDVGEGWAEVDPAQYEGKQTAQMDAELSAQEAATDSAWLEAQAKKRGYDEVTTAYYLNGNSMNLSVEEYDRKFQMAYERGKLGVAQSYAVRAAAGMDPDVVRAAWNAGQKAAAQTKTEKYSIAKDYRQKLRSWEQDGRPEGVSFTLGSTGETLQGLGAVESDIYMNGEKISTILKEHPEMTIHEIQRIPEILDDPVLVLKSRSGRGDNSRLVLFGNIKAKNGQPMMTVLDLRATENGFLLDDMQKVNSAYTKKNPASFIQSSEVLYADKNRTIPLLRQTGLTIASRELLRNGSVGSISYSGKNVKLDGVPFSEIVNLKQEAKKHGTNVSDAGQKRDAGKSAEKQAGGMERAAERRSESARRGEQRAAAARDQAKAWREVSVSEFGLSGDSTVRVMPEGAIAQNADAKRAAEFFRTAGVKDYQFVVGELAVETEHGTYYADALVTEDGTVVVRLDSAQYSAAQLAKHEGYHIAAGRNAELAARIRKRLVAEGKITKAQIDSYIEAYNAIYGENAEAYAEEIIADAYAGINRTVYGTNAIRTDVTMEVGKWTKKTGKSRAPPKEQYSIETLPDGKQFVKADRQVIYGNDMAEWSEQLEDYINGKIRRGQDVTLIGADGDALRLTATSAGKLSSPYTSDGRTMSEAAYERKVNAAAHIDELAQTSVRGKNMVADAEARHGDMASGGWNYRTAYFQDFDGSYYSVTISTAQNENGKLIYNIGQIKREAAPKIKGSSATNGNGPRGGASQNISEITSDKASIRKNGEDVNMRFSANSQRFRDVLPERAAAYVARVENQLLRNLTTNLGVAEGTRREALRPIADEIIYDVLRGEDLNTEKLNSLFETAWEQGREIDREYYAQYKDVAKKIRTTPISISEQDRADIADFGQFRKQTFGTLRITKDGLPVDTAYAELREMAPELFPEGITAPGDQLLKLYDVASGIRITERMLNEGYGEDAKAWAQNDFDAAAQRFAEGLRLTKRYQQYRQQEKEKLAVPQTAEEVEKLAKELRAEKKKFERVRSRYLLTDADMKTVNMLLRGDTTVEAVQNRENAEAILKTYEAKANYDLLALRLKAWNQQRKQGLRDAAETALNEAEADKWVDKSKGLAYSRETMERNVRDIARKGKVDDAKADAFNNEYFYPVHRHESERKNYVVGLQDRIRALKLSRKVAEGNLVSESYAVQWLGEAEFNAEYLKTKYRGGKRGGFSYEEWVAAIEKFRAENPKLDYDKIERAVKEFRAVYDQLFQDMNRVRIENGYEPVDYMQGYFPHFQEEGGTLLTKFARQLGIESDAMPLPTTINGMTAAFKPGIRYMANIQQRLGYATAYDALQGFDRYVEVASDVVYHTGDIQKLRALATQIRYRASEEGVRKQIDKILQDPTKNPDEANEEVAHKLKDARFALSNFVDELDEYTNLLAGKKSRLDRGMEKLVGREAYNVTKAFEQRVGANMVAANIGSALTNFIPITQAWSQVSTQDIVSGMWQTLKNYKQADGLDTVSSFINNRSGYGRLVVTRMDKASNVAGWLMETIDGFTTGSVVRARYQQNLRLGMSEANAMQEADQFAANIMADRSKGSTPTLYQSRNPMVKLFTQFQLEVNNELSWIFKDMVPQERKKGVLALTKALMKFLIGSWLYNEVYEALVGRRAALDPLDILNDTVGDFTGYQLPNTVNAALSGQWDFTKEKPGMYQAIKNLESNLISELPGTQALTMLGLDEAWGLDIDSGRIAVSSAIPDIGAIEKALLASNEDMALKKKVTTVANELIKPAAYAALPFGGGQAKKLVQGVEAVARGGSYAVDTEGRDKLQYPVYNQTKADTAKSLAQALLFGKTATEEAQSWVESGFQSLSADETAAYQSITEYEDQRSTYDFIRAMKNVKLTADKKMLLGSYEGVSEEAKAEYYYQVMATDKQKGDMDGMSTAERIEYVNGKIQEAQSDKLKDSIREEFEAGTISEAKAVEKLVANDFAEDANEAYWKVDEWKRGDAGVYDEVLAVVDAGGDVKKAAQRYLDNGKKAGDIASSITSAYKQRYIAADAAERKRLKALLLDAYAALGYDRKDKSRDIDAWLKQD